MAVMGRSNVDANANGTAGEKITEDEGLSSSFVSSSSPHKQQRTALPMRPVSAIILVLFANSMIMTGPFSFLPYMVRDFGVPPQDVGYFSGFIASAMFFGRFITAYQWGRLCDTWGRKQVIVASTIGVAVFTGAFGFSTSLFTATAMRFVSGCMGGMVPAAKTMLSEVTDDSNAALGMSAMTVGWGLGLVVGPAIGGFLSRPAQKYASLASVTWLQSYPYALPCIVWLAAAVLAATASAHLLDGITGGGGKDAKNNPSGSGGGEGDADVSSSMHQRDRVTTAHHKRKTSDAVLPANCTTMTTTSGGDLEAGSGDLMSHSGGGSRGSHGIGGGREHPSKRAAPSARSLFAIAEVRLALVGYSLMSFGSIAFDEIFPIWASSEHELGGLAWTTNDIGESMMGMGLIMVVFQTISFPILERRFGCRAVAAGSNAVGALLFCLYPILPSLPGLEAEKAAGATAIDDTVAAGGGGIGSAASTAAAATVSRATTTQMIVVSGLSGITRIVLGNAFTAIAILINNCVASETRGTLNGLAMGFTASTRSFAPLMAGSLFAWSISGAHIFPFNVHFSFYVCAAFLLAGAWMVHRLPEKLNSQHQA